MTHKIFTCIIEFGQSKYKELIFMSHYTHLTIEEREQSRCLLEKGLSIRSIARILGRSPSTLSREFNRNSYSKGSYAAHHAQKLYDKRRKNCGKNHILSSSKLVYDYVIDKLSLKWTPEQICGRAKLEKQPFSISFVTIYRAIHNGVLPKELKNKCVL